MAHERTRLAGRVFEMKRTIQFPGSEAPAKRRESEPLW
jgi:hypothetical protein